MALNFGVNHALAQKLWSKDLERDTLQRLWFRDLLGTGSDAIIQMRDDLSKNQGDSVRFMLRGLLTGAGKTEGQTLYGDEEAMTFFYDTIVINELRHAVEVPTDLNIAQQRFVDPDLRSHGKEVLADWFADRFETCIFSHLCGRTFVTDDRYRGNNAITAPTATRLIRAAGQASDEAITSAHLLDLAIIDVAIEKVATLQPKIRPGSVDGKRKFVMFVHPFQATDIMRDTTADGWLNINLQKIAGGSASKLESYEGYLGTYKTVDIFSTKYVETGVNGSTGAAIPTVRRAVFCGAQSAVVAFGKGMARSKFSWAEEAKDYGHSLGIAGSTLWGAKKTKYTQDGTTGEDYGVITISSYGAAHTA
jgi:N4-gp56 family major capsid protein